MKPTKYPENGRGLYLEHSRHREGPPSVFCLMYKGSSRLYTDPKDVWRAMGTAKYTDGSKALRAWCEEIHEITLAKAAPKLDMDQVKAEGFGPEAHDDPTTNTKMIT